MKTGVQKLCNGREIRPSIIQLTPLAFILFPNHGNPSYDHRAEPPS